MLVHQLNTINELFYSSSNSYKTINSHTTELLEIFKTKSLVKFQQKDIEKYIKILKNKGNKNTTINSKLAYLSKSLNYYGNSLKIPYQRINPKQKDIITDAQFKQLQTDIKDKELKQFINIAYYTGLRASEILGLRVQHITRDNQTYYLNIYDTKNHKNNLIPVTNKLNSVLNQFQEFTYNYKQIHYELKKHGITAHQFRHTFITRCFEKGLDVFTVMRLVNQTSIQSTKQYVHLQNKFLKDTVNLL